MMIMKYPKYDDYEKMYKRYFDKGVDYLVNVADVNKDDKVLDLCGGNGRLTRKLKTICDDVSYVDQEKDMIPDTLENEEIKVYNYSIQDFVNINDVKYDKLFCQQAVNYWLLHIDIEHFSKIFKKGGLFIFNTFSKKPSTKPMMKEYKIDDINYLEISYLVGNEVNHIQIREGYEPHFTKFDWISEDEYKKILSPYFDIEIDDSGTSAVYVCRRK